MTVRLAFGLACLALTWLVSSAAGSLLLRRLTLRMVLGLFAISRIVGWVAVYVAVPNLAQYSDLVLFYHPEAQRAVSGLMPYRDFPTSYGLAFPYLAGALLPLWNARAAVALMMIACEIAAVIAFAHVLSRSAGTTDTDTRQTVAVYSVNPAALYWSGMLAYNSSVVLLCWTLAIAALVSARYGRSLGALTASVVVGKFLGFLAVPIWLADRRRRPLALSLAAIVGVAALVTGSAFDINLLLPLLREGGRSTSANLWFLASGLVPFQEAGVVWRVGPLGLFAALAVGLTGLFAIRWVRPPNVVQVCAAVSAIGWLFMLVSKKSYPHYVPMFLLFTVFALCREGRSSRRQAMVLAAFGAIGLIEPGIWNALGQPSQLGTLWLRGDLVSTVSLVVADLALVGGAAYLGLSCARRAIGPTSRADLRPAGR